MRFVTWLLPVLAAFSVPAGAGQAASDVSPPETRVAVSYDQSEESLRQAFAALAKIESSGAIVAYDSRTSKIINKKRAALGRLHPLFLDDALDADDTLLLETRPGDAASPMFYVLFSEGPSADPQFYFVKTDSPDKTWARLAGTALAIPGNGAVYTANRFNNIFTRRSKHLYSASGLTEVSQPYRYVGLKTHTLAPITIYALQDDTQPVAQLPKGSGVEVLLADENCNKQRRTCFLLKTPFGLLGWSSVSAPQYYADAIEGVSFWGD